jgi:hypothetical protein
VSEPETLSQCTLVFNKGKGFILSLGILNNKQKDDKMTVLLQENEVIP